MEQYHFMSRTKGNDCYQACGRYYNPSPMRVHEFVLRTVIVSYSHDFSSTYSQLRLLFFLSPPFYPAEIQSQIHLMLASLS